MKLLKQVLRGILARLRSGLHCAARPVYRALKWDVATIAGCRALVRVDPFTLFGRELLKTGERPTEAFTIPLMKQLLRPGDVYADVGAHWGTYTVVASELVGDKGQVLAIEPTPQNRARLLENIALNQAKNVTVEPVAIGESSGKGVLRFGGDSGNLSALQLADGPNAAADMQSCEVATLAAVLDRNNVPRVRLMKMDIEGAECRASRDVCQYTDRFDCIYIELHPPFANPAEDGSFLYRMLGEGRLLVVADCAGRRFVPVRSREEFDSKIGLYYFFSARADGEMKSLLENFRW